MPIYNFQCTECNHQFEHLALPPVKEELALTCPSCNSDSVKKLFAPGTVSIQYNAEGFYESDNSKDSSSKK